MVMDGARSSMSDRSALRAAFIDGVGWSDAEERLLAGDASFRKYYRLTRPGGTAVVLAPRAFARMEGESGRVTEASAHPFPADVDVRS